MTGYHIEAVTGLYPHFVPIDINGRSFENTIINGHYNCNDLTSCLAGGNTLQPGAAIDVHENGTLTIKNHNSLSTNVIINIYNSGTMRFQKDIDGHNDPALVNDGTINLEGTTISIPVIIADGAIATFNGRGYIFLADGHLCTTNNGEFINGPDHTIEGYGGISGPITNNGIINAAGGTLSLSGEITNNEPFKP